MANDFSCLVNKEIPAALDRLFEMIDETQTRINQMAIGTRQHKDKYFTEYGFFIDKQNKQANIFTGLWFSLWETTGTPLCICLDWKTATDEGLLAKFEEFVKSRTTVFAQYLDFEGYPTALFDIQYLNSLDSSEQLAEVVKEMSEFLDISYKK